MLPVVGGRRQCGTSATDSFRLRFGVGRPAASRVLSDVAGEHHQIEQQHAQMERGERGGGGRALLTGAHALRRRARSQQIGLRRSDGEEGRGQAKLIFPLP